MRRFGDPASGTAVLSGDHWLDVPLDHADPGRGRILLYARELRSPARADTEQPYLLFLQGGPGNRAPRPGADGPGWLAWALDRYRVLLLDQRGTGRSTPQDRHSLAALPDAAARAEQLACFRADSIVADAEALRRHLVGDQPWTVLGQSFGGFCTWTYLSHAPEGLAHAYVTGGIPPTGAHPDDVYRATFAAVRRAQAELDAAHPDARVVLAEVADFLARGAEEYLPTGERLTVPRLQEVGVALGQTGGTDRLAHLADDAWAVPGRRLSEPFLAGVGEVIAYTARPLYALLHEAAYAEHGLVTDWSANRVRDQLGVHPEPVPDPSAPDDRRRLPLTGEMVFPHTVATDPALTPLAEVAELLAQRPWTRPLYDPVRLAANTVPVTACLYTRDLYVDPGLSRATAAATGSVTVVEDDIHAHDGLRRAGAAVLGRLEAAAGQPGLLLAGEAMAQ